MRAQIIDKNQWKWCDQELSLKELKQFISKLNKKKSPSDDGLTGTFQRLFQDHITDLLNVLKEATEACRFLSPMCRGLITPEPDKNQMIQNDNWRPVTQITILYFYRKTSILFGCHYSWVLIRLCARKTMMHLKGSPSQARKLTDDTAISSKDEFQIKKLY